MASHDDAPRLARVRAYYRELRHHATAARQVGWRTPHDQALRFQVCAEALDLPSVTSTLDVGCGLGDLAPFLRSRGFLGDYLGVDVLADMIDSAHERHPGEQFSRHDLAILDLGQRYDLVVACGTLSLAADDPGFFSRALHVLWQHTAQTLVIIVPSARAKKSRPGTQHDAFAYVDPSELRTMGHALSSYTVLREDFLPTDVALIVYRDASPSHARLADTLEASALAWLYLERGLPAQALACLESLEASGHALDALGWLRRGQAFDALGAGEAAVAAWQQALMMDPMLEEARLYLGV